MHFRWKSRFAQKGRTREGSTGSKRLLCKSEIVKQSKRICMNTKIKYLTKYEYTETVKQTEQQQQQNFEGCGYENSIDTVIRLLNISLEN